MTTTATVFFDGRILKPSSPLDLQPNRSYVISIRKGDSATAEFQPQSDATEANTTPEPSKANLRMLELIRAWQTETLAKEEERVLDDFDEFQARHPLRLARMDEDP